MIGKQTINGEAGGEGFHPPSSIPFPSHFREERKTFSLVAQLKNEKKQLVSPWANNYESISMKN